MTDVDTNDLELLTEEELAAAIAFLAPLENAREMATAVAAIPAEERPFYRWAYEVVVAASSVSTAVAARIQEHFGHTAEAREKIAAEQQLFRSWRASGGAIRVTFRLEEVVIDTRDPIVGLGRAYTAPVAEPLPS